MNSFGKIGSLFVIIVTALGVGWYVGQMPAETSNQQKAVPKKENKLLYWVAPMDAGYRRDKAGKSPMGMDLVPVYADGAGDSTGDDSDEVSVSITAAVENNMGVRTAIVKSGKLWRKIDTVGYVGLDESRVSHIHLRVDGWIENLAVNVEGDRVKKGQRLFDIYSPKLVNSMEEYVQSLRSTNRRLMNASREKLISLGVSKKQIERLNKTKEIPQTTSFYASQDGIVSMMMVREGMYVKPSTQVMSLADLSSVWVLAEVFESQSQWVELGQTADVELSFIPGRKWEGIVDYVYPSLDAKNRTLKVRLRFDNPGELLKPNMYTSVSVFGGAKNNVLSVPREAVLRSGKNERLIIAKGNGRYVQREVTVGMESDDLIEIKSGITQGEKVVISAQFLIDSEASMKASFLRMSETGDESIRAIQTNDMTNMPEENVVIAKARGNIDSLMIDHGMITLQHEAIESLAWPAMTMDFITVDGVSLEGLSSGDEVLFELIKSNDKYLVSSITKQGDE